MHVKGVIHMCCMCSSSIFYMLTAAWCECIGSGKYVLTLAQQQDQICSAKTKYVNIFMYITMPIPLRVVITEIYVYIHECFPHIDTKSPLALRIS